MTQETVPEQFRPNFEADPASDSTGLYPKTVTRQTSLEIIIDLPLGFPINNIMSPRQNTETAWMRIPARPTQYEMWLAYDHLNVC